MTKEEMQVLVEEVARVALEEWDIRERVAHELGVDEEELQEVLAHLEAKIFPNGGSK
jgi:energy-converting hydrogenase A subunit M